MRQKRKCSIAAKSLLCHRLCCKTIFRIRARKIDSRSRVNAQHRFAPIRLLRISIPQLLRGDFCNTIPSEADIANVLSSRPSLGAHSLTRRSEVRLCGQIRKRSPRAELLHFDPKPLAPKATARRDSQLLRWQWGRGGDINDAANRQPMLCCVLFQHIAEVGPVGERGAQCFKGMISVYVTESLPA